MRSKQDLSISPEYTKRPKQVRFNLDDIVIDIPVEYDIDDLNLIRLNTGDQALSAGSELVVIIEEIKGSILIDTGASKRSYISQCFVKKLLVVKPILNMNLVKLSKPIFTKSIHGLSKQTTEITLKTIIKSNKVCNTKNHIKGLNTIRE